MPPSPVASAGAGRSAGVGSLVFPGPRALREARYDLARGGLPLPHKRGPEEQARLAAYRVVENLLHLVERFRRRVERGEACRLVVKELLRASGRVVLELVIEEEQEEHG